jgi:hypothetical protein
MPDGNGKGREEQMKKLGDDSKRYKEAITQLIERVYQSALDYGQLALSTENQWKIFRKKMLDLGNESQRELNNILTNVIITEMPAMKIHDTIHFNGVDKEGRESEEGKENE